MTNTRAVEEEKRIFALLALESALPALDAIVPRRPSRDSVRPALDPVLARQWADATGAAPIAREVAERDAGSVMAVILENNSYFGDNAVRCAEVADAVLQALHIVVERSRVRERQDGRLVRLAFSAETLREVLVELERVPELASSIDLEALRERAHDAAGEPSNLRALRAETEREAARYWTPERLAALARA